ncbi:MAG: peptidase [Streptosporangiaceae bacterium]|nr:peptidase [Streptosporangiaceae bacterium]
MSVPLITRALLFGEPARQSPAISPDGSLISFLAPHNGVLNIWVGDRVIRDSRPVTDCRRRGITMYSWASDGRHLLYVQDRDGDENTHVHAVDLTTGDERDLTPFDGVQAHIIGLDRRVPGELLVGMNLRTRGLHDAYRISLAGGEPRLVAENTGFGGWVADRDLQVRGAVSFRSDGGMDLLVRDGEEDPWRVLHSARYEDTGMTRPIGFTDDGKRLTVLSSVDSNTTRLVSIEVASGDVEVVYEDPRFDVVGVDLNPDSRHPDLAVVLRERNHLEVLDPALERDVEVLRAAADGDVVPLSRDDRDRWWIVQDNIDDAPAGYLLYDRVTGRVETLFTHQPALEGAALARMDPFTITARDGLELSGYLTFPPNEPRVDLPAVLNVHGGPWMRDGWGFRGEVQWLANRGYLVIQVNFRGSTGYGKDFARAGDREWGGRMQDDLIDAVQWAVRCGFADPGRIGIYGTSYGGYAALAGAAFSPDLFRCALSVCGPSNLRTFVESVPAYWAPMAARLRRAIGDPESEPQFLWARSPLSRADAIRIPVFIAQGANDPRVKEAESEQIVTALRERGVEHHYMIFDDEGHGFVDPRNRLAFYAAAERFLADHLGGRCEATSRD